MILRLYNTLTRQIEDFKPLHDKSVGMYTCGPTVYDFASIGNFRTYIASDILFRTLQFNGYDVKWVSNITDVGHLVSDGDEGEDKMEKGSRRTGKSAWEIAQFYTDIFLQDWQVLQLSEPNIRPRPTQHISEQIALVQKLLDKGYAYQIDDGIYFDTSKAKEYGKLAQLDLRNLQEGARVEVNPQKHNPTDFALWKLSPRGEQRQMEWESPWGVGFPGWHIECSAMSMKYLGEHFDIHTGGTDLMPVHHVNEIAQSEAATGYHPWVNYWVHGQMMLVQGQKMSKSLGNVYRLYDLEKEGFEPLALRYLYLQTHYRQEMNFTFPALEAAKNALGHIRQEIVQLTTDQLSMTNETAAARSKEQEELMKNHEGVSFDAKFLAAINNDLNMPEALSVVWEMLKSDLAPQAKLRTLFHMDSVLGLDLKHWMEENKKVNAVVVPREVKDLIAARNQLRRERRFAQADQVRNQIKKLGFDIEDNGKETVVRKISI